MDETRPLLGSVRVEMEVDYQTVQQVILPLPPPHPRAVVSAEPEPESDPKSINIDETAPTSYVCLGYTFSIIAGFCFTFCNVGIKFAGLHVLVSAWQMLLVRCLGQSLGMLPLTWWYDVSLLGTPDIPTRWRLCAQGVVGGTFLLCIFEAVQRLPIGDCTAIFFSTPAVTLILSALILRDHCGLYRTLIGTCLVSGVVIISRPPALFSHTSPATSNTSSTTNCSLEKESESEDTMKESYDMIGLGFALAVPVLGAWIAIITRELRHIHYSVLVFWFAVGGLVISILGICCLDTVPLFSHWTVITWLLSIQQAVLGILGSVLMTKAVCWISPSKSMVIRSFQVIISYIVQVNFFGTIPHVSDIFGSLLIVSAVLTIGLEDSVMNYFSCRYL